MAEQLPLEAAGDLLRAAQQCLAATDPLHKVALTQAYAVQFRAGQLKARADAAPPAPIRMPGRPSRPHLVHGGPLYTFLFLLVFSTTPSSSPLRLVNAIPTLLGFCGLF